MDFSKLNTAALAETGSSMIICYPATKTPILDDKKKPAFIKIRGPSSDVMKAFVRANEKEALRDGRNVEDDEDFSLRFALAATIDFVNIPWEGKVLAFNPDNAKMLFRKHEFIIAQMLSHFKSGDNFLPVPPLT
jgi:hypothetical protein